ncbi:Uncharacterised protein [Streptococcus pneumoniae]|nr:Uncharacterised protein [Streptococcus pneumoniae]
MTYHFTEEYDIIVIGAGHALLRRKTRQGFALSEKRTLKTFSATTCQLSLVV